MGAVRSHTVGLHSSGGFTSHHSPHIHVYTHTHTHRLFYFGPLLLARHDFFAFVRRRHGRSHPEYPKLIHSTDELCGNFLPFHKPDSWAGPQQQQQQQRHRTHSPAAIKRLFECLHGLQSIQSLLFAWVDLFTGLPIKERRRLYSLYIIVKLIAFCLSCDVENGWSCQRTGFFFLFIVTFLLFFGEGGHFPPVEAERKNVFFSSFFISLFFVFFSTFNTSDTGGLTDNFNLFLWISFIQTAVHLQRFDGRSRQSDSKATGVVNNIN